MDWIQVGVNAIVCAAASGGSVYFRGYLGKKGENRATKEDVGELTRAAERIRDEYVRGITELASTLSARTSLRMLAGERRLATHQDAYARWHHLLIAAPTQAGSAFADDCILWWRENALFLDAEPRTRFFDAANAARVHYLKVETLRGKGDAAAEHIVDNMNIIRSAGPAIVRACELPTLKADDGTDASDGANFGTPGFIQLPPSGK